jgi:predicted permease
VVAGGLFVRGALNVAVTDPGFSLDRQLVVGVDASMAGYDEARGRATYRTMLEHLRALPGVDHATFASTVPFGDMTEGRDVHVGDRKASAIYVIVGADYFRTIGLPMLRGREFTTAEEEPSARAGTLAIVNEPLARKLFGDADPIGRQLQAGEAERGTERTFEIVGVAPGLRHEMFDAAPVAQMYVASGGPYRGSMNVHLHAAGGPGSESALFEPVRRALHDVDPRLPIVSMRTMAAHSDASILSWSIRVGAGLFSAFGVLALLLATIGVYGLKAYDVSRRTREIGIRMAIGATSADVQRLMMGEGLRTTVIGLVIGLLLAVGIGKLVSGLLYRVSPFDPMVLAVAAAVLSATAMLACYLPARRATRVVPLEALRSE